MFQYKKCCKSSRHILHYHPYIKRYPCQSECVNMNQYKHKNGALNAIFSRPLFLEARAAERRWSASYEWSCEGHGWRSMLEGERVDYWINRARERESKKLRGHALWAGARRRRKIKWRARRRPYYTSCRGWQSEWAKAPQQQTATNAVKNKAFFRHLKLGYWISMTVREKKELLKIS